MGLAAVRSSSRSRGRGRGRAEGGGGGGMGGEQTRGRIGYLRLWQAWVRTRKSLGVK